MQRKGGWELQQFVLAKATASSPETARKNYKKILNAYKAILTTDVSRSTKQMCYRQTQEVHAMAQRAKPSIPVWPLAFVAFAIILTLFLRPGITGLFGAPVSGELPGNSSSPLRGAPDTLVFDGDWNGLGIGRLYVVFPDGTKLLGIDTTLLPTMPGAPFHFTDECALTCLLDTDATVLSYETELIDGAQLSIEKIKYTYDAASIADEPVASPSFSEPEVVEETPVISPSFEEPAPLPILETPIIETEPTPTSTVITPETITKAPAMTFTPSAFEIESIGSTSPANGTPDSVDAQGINDGFSSTDSVTVDTINTGNDAYVGLLRLVGPSDLEGYLNMSYNISNITTQAGVTLTNFTFFLDHCYGGDPTAPVTCGTTPTGTVERGAIELYNFSNGAYKKVSDWLGTDTTEGTHMFNVTQGLSDFVSATQFVNIRYVVNLTIDVLRPGSFGADLSVMDAQFTLTTSSTVCQTIGAGIFLMNNSVNTTGPSCYNFSANNAMLDCNGYSITGAQTANSHGVNASSRTNVTVRNCYITNFSDGIFFTRVQRGLLFNNTFFNNTDDGLDLNNNNFTLVSHNVFANNTDNGMELTGWFDNVTNNTFVNNRGAATSHGMQTFRGAANVPGSGPAHLRIVNNTFIDNQNDGLNTAWLNYTVIVDNLFMRNGDDALSLTNATALNVTGNAVGAGGDDGVLIEGTNHSFIAFNNVSERGGQNIDVVRSSNNNFTNNTLFYSNVDPLRLRIGSVNNTFWNTTILSNDSWLTVNDTSTDNNNFTNTTFANSNGSIRLSFFQGNVSQEINTTTLNISNNRAYLNATNLTWMNASATIILDLASTGIIDPVPKVDYGDTLTYVACPADVCTENSFVGNRFNFNVSHWTSFSASESPSTAAITSAILNSTEPPTNSTYENLTLYLTASDDDSGYFTNVTDWQFQTGSNFTSWTLINLPFDNNISATTARAIKDFSTFQNNGTLGDGTAGFAPIWNATGMTGGAYWFDGTDDRISITHDQSQSPESNALTLEAWINTPEATSGYDKIIVKPTDGGGDPYNRYALSRSSGTGLISFELSTGGVGTGSGVLTTAALSINTWHHIVGTYDGKTARIYVDGVLNNTAGKAGNVGASTTAVMIGGNPVGGGEYFMGSIDDVRVYNRTLSAEQVQLNYLAGLASKHPLTLLQNETRPGETWKVAVTPVTRASILSTVFSNNVTILTTETPNMTNYVLNSSSSTSNSTDHNLTVFLNGTDPYRTNLSINITDWRRYNGTNFTSIARLNMPFDVYKPGSPLNGVSDYSTFQNNGTPGKGLPFTSPLWNESGIVGGAYQFDGSNDYINIPHSASLDITGPAVTVEAWVNTPEVSSAEYDRIVIKEVAGNADPYAVYGLFREGGTGKFGFSVATGGAGTNSDVYATVAPVANTWYHVVGTYDGANIKIYINGELNNSEAKTGNIASSTPPVVIGGDTEASIEFYRGLIDQVRIYNMTLNATQIRANYEAEVAGRHPDTIVANMTETGDIWLVAGIPSNEELEGPRYLTNNITIADDAVVEGDIINIAACSNLSHFGKTYRLTADVTSTQTCFHVQNHNITLDCNGKTVTYGGSSNIADGVNVSHARNTTIIGCVLNESASGTSSPYYSVEIRGSNYTRILNNSMFVRTSSSAGVESSGSFFALNNSVINNSITTHNNGYGIYLQVNTGNNIIDNRIEMNGTSTGISGITFGTGGNNATVESNRIFTKDNKGIIMAISGSANMTVINNTITSNTSTALEVGASGATGNSNIVINNTLRSVTGNALHLYSSHNLLWQNTMSTWSGHTLHIQGSANNNSLINNTLYAHNGTTIYADTTASKVRFQNTTLFSNSSWFYSVHSSNTDINFTDLTFVRGNGSIRFTGNGTFPIGDANISIMNITINASRAFVKTRSMLMFNQSAEVTWHNRAGDDPQLFYVHITCTAGGVCTDRETTSCPADLCTQQSYAANTLKFNVSHWSAYETQEAGTYCGELFESTTLKTDLESNATCITIRTSDMVLDCNGTMIVYANVTQGGGDGDPTGGNAIMVNSSNNVTIKNCNLRQKAGGRDSPAINFTGVNNSAVLNTTIRTNGSESSGIYTTLSHRNNFSNSIITIASTANPSAAHGIYLFTTNTHNRAENNTILTVGGASSYGIDIDTNAHNNTLVRNNVTVTEVSTSTHRGILVTNTAHNNTLQHNTVRVNGAANNYGIYVFGTSLYTIIENNTVDMNGTSTTNVGIVLETGGTSNQYARVLNNTVRVNGSSNSIGIYLASNIYNTSITNNTIIVNSSGASDYGIYTNTAGAQSNITNNVIYADGNSTDEYGINLATAGKFINVVDNLIMPNGGAASSSPSYGVYIQGATSHLNISRNTVLGRSRLGVIGMQIAGSNNSVFENIIDLATQMEPFDTTQRGIVLTGSPSGGTALYNLTMRANTINLHNTMKGPGTSGSIGIWYSPTYASGPANGNGTNKIENNTINVTGPADSNIGIFADGDALWGLFANNLILVNGTGNNTGIYIEGAHNNTFENNTVIVNGTLGSNYGIEIAGATTSFQNNFTRNTITTDGSGNNSGIVFLSSSHTISRNQFKENNITTQGVFGRNFGVRMEPVSLGGPTTTFNNFTGNRFTTYGPDSHGVIMQTSSSGAPIVRDNLYTNNTITTFGAGSYGIFMSSGTAVQQATTSFNNTILDNPVEWYYVGSNAILNLSTVRFKTPNGTIEHQRLVMGGNNNASQFAINITSNRAYINTTFVGGGLPSLNSSSNITLNLTGYGFVTPRPATDFHHTGINTTCVFTDCTNRGFVNNILTFNVSHWTIYTAEETTSSLCGPITTNTIMLSNVSASGTCFTIEADDVTLDCNGTTITYDTGGNGGNGVNVLDYDNAVIKNCFIQDATVAGAGSIAVNLTRSNDSLVFNNTLITNGTTTNYGVLVQTGSYRNTIANNTIRVISGTSTNYGIFLTGIATTNSVQYNNLSYNNITVNGTSSIMGIRLEMNAHNTTIHHNNISINTTLTTSNNGISFTAAGGGAVRYNNITKNDIKMRTGGTSAGIALNTNADYNLIANNTINVSGTSTSMVGIDVFTSVNDTVIGNNVSVFGSSTVIGMRATTTAHYNQFLANAVSVNGTSGTSYGLRISSTVNGNNASHNWIRADGTGGNIGVLVDTTAINTTVDNNTIFADGSSSANLGIQLVTTSVVGTRIAYNTIRTNGTGGNNRGIDITVSDNTTIENNTIYTNGPTPGATQSSNFGILVSGATTARTNITGNKIYTNGTGLNVGVRMDTNAFQATIENNTIVTDGNETNNFGISFNSANIRNNITGNLIITNGREGNHALFFAGSSDNNTVRYNNLTVNSNKSRAFYFLASSNTNASHNTLNGYTYINSSAGTVNNFTNTSFRTPNATVRFPLRWQLNGSIDINSSRFNITLNRTTLNATNLTMLNTSAFITFDLTGLSFGTPGPGVDYADVGSYVACPASVCTVQDSTLSRYTFNVSHWTSFAVMDISLISACGTISAAGTYSLSGNIATTGNCITIGANDVTLDCRGFTITATSGTGIIGNGYNNTVIKNCAMTATSPPVNSPGISLQNCNNVTLYNNSVHAYTTYLTAAYATYFVNCPNVTVTTNNLSALGGDGVLIPETCCDLECGLGDCGLSPECLYDCSYGTNGADGTGVYASNTPSFLVINNTAKGVGGTKYTGYADGTGYGLAAYTAPAFNVTNNTLIGSTYSLLISNASHGTIKHNSANGSMMAPNNFNHNVTYESNRINTTVYGIYSSGNATILNNTITSVRGTQPTGIYAYTGDNLTIDNNNISVNASAGAIARGIVVYYDSAYVATQHASTRVTNNRVLVEGKASTSALPSAALFISWSSNGTYENNTLRMNLTRTNLMYKDGGIVLSVANNNTFHNNIVNVSRNISTAAVSVFDGNFSVFNNTVLDGNTDWLSSALQSLNNFTNTTFNSPNGSVRFPGTFWLNASEEVNRTNLNISLNRTRLNASNLTFMNKSAFITLNGLPFTDPKAVVDYTDLGPYADCPVDVCTEVSYVGSVFTFNVSHWTSFAAQETAAANVAPSVNSSILNTTNPLTNNTNENLTLYLNVTDSDSASVKNITNWFVNNVSIMTFNMPFEGANNESATRDYTPFKNNATFVSAIYNSTGGVDGRGAYQYNGSGTYVEIPDAASLDFDGNQTEFTVMAWAKHANSTLEGYETILSKGSSGGCVANYALFFNSINGNMEFEVANSSDCTGLAELVSTSVWNRDTWYHVAGVYNRTWMGIYINGVLEASGTRTPVPKSNTGTLRIGWGHATQLWNGSIDDVRIYNRSLSPEQIFAIFSNRSTIITKEETEKDEIWHACVVPNDNIVDGAEVCSNNVTITGLSAPVNLYPANNSNITDRSPNFNWSNSTGGFIGVNYSLEIATDISFSSIVYNRTNISSLINANSTNYTINYTLDTDRVYWWRVIAYDGTQFSAYSNATNFTLQSFLNFSLPIRHVDFGNASLGSQNDTVDEAPRAFWMQNDGNLPINITITSTRLFSSGSYPADNYRFKARVNESNAFNISNSTMNWTQFVSSSVRTDFNDLNWTNTNDDARLDVNITVPTDEPAGLRNATVTFTIP